MSYEEFEKEAAQKWAQLHEDLFGTVTPSRVEWTRLEDMVAILNRIGKTDSFNHMYFPDHGGMDLMAVWLSAEKDCIELGVNGVNQRYIVKPGRLVFESIDLAQDLNYFRLENDTLDLTGVYERPPMYMAEELLELTPGDYVDRKYADVGEYKGEQLPATARIIIRYFKGDIVIFKKTSRFNTPSSYDAQHEKMGRDGFRSHIKAVHKAIAVK